MKTSIISSLALGAILAAASFAADDDPKRVVATVNGLEITELRLKDAQSPGDRKEKLEKLIDNALLLDAARKLNANVPPELVKERIDAIVRESFAGDRFKMESQLLAEGYTMKAFEKLQEEEIILNVMKREVTKQWADAESRRQALEAWLKTAREKAEISYK